MKRLVLIAALATAAFQACDDGSLEVPVRVRQAAEQPFTFVTKQTSDIEGAGFGTVVATHADVNGFLASAPQGGFFYARLYVEGMAPNEYWNPSVAWASGNYGQALGAGPYFDYVGGPAGLWREAYNVGSMPSDNIWPHEVFAMTAMGPQHLVASTRANGGVPALLVFDAFDDSISSQWLVDAGAGFGASLAYHEAPDDAGWLVAGSPQERRVYVFKNDGGLAYRFGFDDEPGFGSAVGIGNLTPEDGLELVVATSSNIVITALSGEAPQQVLELDNEQSIEGVSGTSLAVEPWASADGLHAFWVGDGARSRVYRCLGSECDVWATDAGTRFGRSVAINRRDVLVGAPGFQGGGAVFGLSRADAGEQKGKARRCSADAGCPLECGVQPLCVGGVFCQLPSSVMNTCNADGGVDGGANVPDGGEDGGVQPGDAGEADGGEADGGVEPEFDGGSKNERDAGVRDGGGGGASGPVSFTAGCASAPGGALWFALALLARRRIR